MTEIRTFGRRNAPVPTAKAVRPDRDEAGETSGVGWDRSLLGDWSKYAAAAAVAFLIVVLLSTTRNDGEPAQVASAPNPAPPVKCGATLAEFYEIRPGMSYRDVRDIIGCEGELSLQMTVMGRNHASVRWDSQNANYGSMTASFRDGSLVSRMQINLE